MSQGQDYYANYGGLSVADYVERHVRANAGEMERMRRTVELVPADVRTLLDVGAGHGVFLEELKAARGIAGTGIEITPAKVDYARSRGVDLRLGDAGALAFEDRSFDAVISCEVLEHLPFGVYEKALTEFARVAREWVIVTVPFDEHRRFIRCPYCGAQVNPDYHFRAFPPGSMQGLVPGFALQQSLELGSQRRPLGLDLARRLLDRWPRFLVCPACGFHEPETSTAAASASGGEGGLRAVARSAARWWPATSRPVWLVGVFRREAGHA